MYGGNESENEFSDANNCYFNFGCCRIYSFFLDS